MRNNLALFIVLITMVAVMSLPFDYSIFLRTSVLLSLVSPLVLMLLSSAWSKRSTIAFVRLYLHGQRSLYVWLALVVI